MVTLAYTGPESVVGARSPIVNQLELSVHEETFQRDWSTEINTEQTGNGSTILLSCAYAMCSVHFAHD